MSSKRDRVKRIVTLLNKTVIKTQAQLLINVMNINLDFRRLLNK